MSSAYHLAPSLFQSDIKVNINIHTNNNIALKWIFEMSNFGHLTVHLNAIIGPKLWIFPFLFLFIMY